MIRIKNEDDWLDEEAGLNHQKELTARLSKFHESYNTTPAN